jgi:hypothetical protein
MRENEESKTYKENERKWIKNYLKTGRVVQGVQHLPNKHEALSSSPSTTKKRHKLCPEQWERLDSRLRGRGEVLGLEDDSNSALQILRQGLALLPRLASNSPSSSIRLPAAEIYRWAQPHQLHVTKFKGNFLPHLTLALYLPLGITVVFLYPIIKWLHLLFLSLSLSLSLSLYQVSPNSFLVQSFRLNFRSMYIPLHFCHLHVNF